MTDPIADFLTRLRNAGKVSHTKVTVPYSRIKMALAQILEREGYLANVKTEGEGVEKIISVLDDQKADLQFTRRSAQWSLRANAKQHKRVYEIIKAASASAQWQLRESLVQILKK